MKPMTGANAVPLHAMLMHASSLAPPSGPSPVLSLASTSPRQLSYVTSRIFAKMRSR
jgi:hypothetical protein